MLSVFSTRFQQAIVCNKQQFAVVFLLRLDSLASKSVFAIKFTRANLEFTTSAAKVLNFGEVIYLS